MKILLRQVLQIVPGIQLHESIVLRVLELLFAIRVHMELEHPIGPVTLIRWVLVVIHLERQVLACRTVLDLLS